MAAFKKVHLEQLECVGGPKDGETICIEHYRDYIDFCVKEPSSIGFLDEPHLPYSSYKKVRYEKRLHKNGKYYLVYAD